MFLPVLIAPIVVFSLLNKRMFSRKYMDLFLSPDTGNILCFIIKKHRTHTMIYKISAWVSYFCNILYLSPDHIVNFLFLLLTLTSYLPTN